MPGPDSTHKPNGPIPGEENVGKFFIRVEMACWPVTELLSPQEAADWVKENGSFGYDIMRVDRPDPDPRMGAGDSLTMVSEESLFSAADTKIDDETRARLESLNRGARLAHLNLGSAALGLSEDRVREIKRELNLD